MTNTKACVEERKKEGKELVELIYGDRRDYVLLGNSEINFLKFLQEEGYLAYEAELQFINEIDFIEF